jgi:ATP-dependent protease ClpP protease subunit
MGGVLLQAGDRRIMTPNSYVMIHEVSSGDYGSTSQLRDTVEHMEALENHIVEIFLSRVKISRKRFLENWNRKEWWLGASEAVKVGIADEVGYA